MAKSMPSITLLADECCGCGACAARCPNRCISMQPDDCGFARPVIDEGLCARCAACDAVCPVLNLPAEDVPRIALWAKAEERKLLEQSSSGGVFGLLARSILSCGGIVVGAAWNNGCRELHHITVESVSELGLVQRSKYVSSSVERETYERIRVSLSACRPVLFCGTACQVAGVRSYLGAWADSDLFLGIDVICHGVPSPELWRLWIRHMEVQLGGVMSDVNFRSKETGWTSFSVAYQYATEKECVSRYYSNKYYEDWYMKAFLSNASLRPSCYSCPFKRRCGSDITLGDYWGIRASHPEVTTDDGVSAVIVNSERGKEALVRISSLISFGESNFDDVVAGNPSLVRPVRPYRKRGAFMAAVASGMPIADMRERWTFAPSPARKLVKRLIRFVRGRSA